MLARMRAMAAMAAVCVATAASGAEGEIGPDKAAILPIADVHFHAMRFMSPPELATRMEARNIRWAGGGGAMSSPPQQTGTQRDDEFQAVLKERYIRAVGLGDIVQGYQKERDAFFTDPDTPMQRTVLETLETHLKDGVATSIAEVHVNSRTSAPLPVVNRKVPADSAFMRRLMDLSARYQVPLSVHMQFDPDSVQQLHALLQAKPQGILVLAHCGKDTAAAQVRPFLEKYGNVHCDLSFRSTPQEKGRLPERIIFTRNSLDSAWRALIEEFPDRFMVGVDDVHSWGEYEQVVDSIRLGLLARLTPPTAEKVAYRNGVRLFRLK
jgi:hypothetical protein